MIRKSILLLTILSLVLLPACKKSDDTPSQTVDNNPEINNTDTITSASPNESANPADLYTGLSDTGYWLFAILDDVTLDKDLTVAGDFYNRNDTSSNLYRKLALYSQDASFNITAQYTLTVPKMTVLSPNFRIQNGTIIGDIYVETDGFEMINTVLDGNLYYNSKEQMESANTQSAVILGTITVR